MHVSELSEKRICFYLKKKTQEQQQVTYQTTAEQCHHHQINSEFKKEERSRFSDLNIRTPP
jgi:hypothetical protein